MPCFHPLKGFRSRSLGAGGSYSITFNPLASLDNRAIQLPCGQCIGCRLERSRQWALRCLHESQLWEDNCFLTLTYRDADLPDDYSVSVREMQLFLKRLRKKYPSNKIRFYLCGEYGEKTNRPHYHLLLFNFRFNDQTLHSESNGNKIYISKQLQALWPYGFSTIGEVSFESAAYVARYIMKKITGDPAVNHYSRVHPVTGELVSVKPEFTNQSRKPGIGSGWFEKYKSDCFPSDFIIARGQKMRPPRFYDQRLSEEEIKLIKRQRINNAKRFKSNNTPDRLAVREYITKRKLKLLPRNLTEDDQ